MTRDEILSNPEYLSACVMKHMWRGELDRARFYLERLILIGSCEPSRERQRHHHPNNACTASRR
jgi:hypothetical protein